MKKSRFTESQILAILTEGGSGIPVAEACRIAGLSRAALYREPTNRIERDAPVVNALNETVERHGRWGFWKCFQRLRDQGYLWNHKRVCRVYCSMN